MVQQIYSRSSPPACHHKCCKQKTSEDTGMLRSLQSPNSPNPQDSAGRGATLTCSTLGFALVLSILGTPTLNHAKFSSSSGATSNLFKAQHLEKSLAPTQPKLPR